ncbi:Voltage-dependent calcium channel subunit alpha-2/delta-4 [Homalodisca vitripennis]|nr:Voltage-dependent calcium channel subunit alpha-2/delta-4 [Homalodisca vitripennis]
MNGGARGVSSQPITCRLRIMDSAEQAALSQKMEGGTPKYYNSRKLANPGEEHRGPGWQELLLIPNRHFDHQAVNTSFSSVLLPQALSDSDPQVINALRWSEHLDPVFVNNYEVDPSLSWQFYGSTTGFLRRFPAMKWPTEEVLPVRDLHDFRWSSWFVGAADSPKDIVILLDTSNSMSGNNKQLARATVAGILDTLTDNDFVNVFTFSEVTTELLPCYKDMLAQATEANRRELKSALDGVKSDNIANFTGAFATAFEILHKYNRTGQGCQCNQAIMLVTDGPSNSFQEVFKQYNWPHMPVRVFTYLVGKDTSNAKEMHWIACNNKGYYEHVKSVEEVTEKVLNYVKVMARPMVMYQNDHPIHWTPVYAGGKTNTLLANSVMEGQLMTSVSTPIFDRRNYSERAANLLGVVGTDIPIRQLMKLVPPYKLGVNGYSFIVNNNGHVLYHPDLRPLFVETLKPNYNNVDLSSVELVDSETMSLENNTLLMDFVETLKPNYNNVDLSSVELVDSETMSLENNTLLMDLRHDMIEQKEGETELRVKVHYDDMKRVTIRRHKYFYHPIDDTPFSLGLALPDGYGMYEVLAEQEIKLSHINVTEYFKGNNWRVHPDWVYCEYNYANEHYFASPEEQVVHFLSRTRRPGWKWMSLRPRSPHRSSENHAGTKKMEKESYYCDKSLMQSLVFDAMITHDIQRAPTSTLKEDKQRVVCAPFNLSNTNALTFYVFTKPDCHTDGVAPQLRHDMIEQKEGETELRVKVHYDDMKRVTIRRHKYFYHPIDDTPFSLGLALPDGYGMYEVLAEQEIKLSHINVTEYFKGNNWRVHPDWVYCEYNYANEHYFASPEEQVVHFLSRTRRPGWKWMSLRPRSPHRSSENHAGTKKMEKESYYCDKSLMQSLVFDAMITHDIQRAPTSTLKEDKQ